MTSADEWYRCKGRCRISVYVLLGRSFDYHYSIADILSELEHESHQCDTQYCPIPCQLCKRLCWSSNHLHALEGDANHLCGYVFRAVLTSYIAERDTFCRNSHTCTRQCTAPGVCEIDMAPDSIEETFRGRHECFQYTKVQVLLTQIQTLNKPGIVYAR
jgi:hypothetical protein